MSAATATATAPAPAVPKAPRRKAKPKQLAPEVIAESLEFIAQELGEPIPAIEKPAPPTAMDEDGEAVAPVAAKKGRKKAAAKPKPPAEPKKKAAPKGKPAAIPKLKKAAAKKKADAESEAEASVAEEPEPEPEEEDASVADQPAPDNSEAEEAPEDATSQVDPSGDESVAETEVQEPEDEEEEEEQPEDEQGEEESTSATPAAKSSRKGGLPPSATTKRRRARIDLLNSSIHKVASSVDPQAELTVQSVVAVGQLMDGLLAQLMATANQQRHKRGNRIISAADMATALQLRLSRELSRTIISDGAIKIAARNGQGHEQVVRALVAGRPEPARYEIGDPPAAGKSASQTVA